MGDDVLDAAAGDCPDRHLFSNCNYESCDFVQNSRKSHNYICDLQSIPVPDEKYNIVLCMLAMDDFPDPQKCIDELHRVLKPGGHLFITAPFNGRVHGDPYHFFHFSKYGLRLLFERSQFEIVRITPWGGIFSCVSHFCFKMPKYLISQQPLQNFSKTTRSLLRILFRPGWKLAEFIVGRLVPLACYYLDPLDDRKDFTLGYSCHCRKMSKID
jgi:SAM-dependent methyltransferase